MKNFKRNFILKNLLVLSFFLPIYPSSIANTGDFRNKYLDNSNRKINFQEDLYILGPGDKLVITVLGSKVTSGNYDVMNDGSINMPLVGDIMLRGKTLPEASNEIKRRLSDQIISPEVSIKLDVPRPVTIFVLGEVESPGLYVMTLNRVENGVSILGHPTVVYAIQNAGGITQKADLSEVELLRLLPGNKNEYKKAKLNLLDLIMDGQKQNNPYLFDGDIIKLKESTKDPTERVETITSNNLTPKTIKVSIIGEVQSPGTKQISSTTPLFQSILQAGGPINNRFSRANVDLFRIRKDGSASHSSYTIDFKKGITPKNPLLKNGDVVRVRRNALAKSSDALKSISDPLQGVVTIYSLFKIID
tara:strand:- start:411 stop:1493 length:1083 start_codon:yes stop_codon:yes gene_type:complete